MGTHRELVSKKDGMYRRIYDIQTKIDGRFVLHTVVWHIL